MKIDAYTKFVLTVIAFCLVVLTLNTVDIFPKAYANDVVNYGGNYGLVPMNEDGTINVRLHSINDELDKIDVNITGVKTYDKLKIDLAEISTREELDINIEEVGGWSVNGGKLPIQD